MPELTRITRDPAVMGGKPCIRGMRVTVGTVVGLVAAGRTRDEILREYPAWKLRTSLRPCPKPPGGQRESKFRCASREATRGHEPVAKLGRALGGARVRGCPLVHRRCRDRAGRRDPGVGERAPLRRYHERPRLLGNPRGRRRRWAERRPTPDSGPALRRRRAHPCQSTRSAP